MKGVNHIRYISGLTVLLLSCINLEAQSFEVNWIGQFPDPDQPVKGAVRERLAALVFGRGSFDVTRPFGVVAEDSSHFWVLDQGSGNVAEVRNGQGRFLEEIRRSGEELPSLIGICRLPGGTILITDSRRNRVFAIRGGRILPLGDSLQLNQPTGIAYCAATDEIWVVETGAHQISVLNTRGALLRTIGGRGTDPGAFNFPTFIWIDRSGRVYIVDSMNFRVQVLDQQGAFLECFGESGDGTGDMARPKGVATDSYGNIYLADALFHAVQIFSGEGKLLHTFGKQGQGPGEFWMPSGIYIDPYDFIYVADGYNSRVQIFKLVQN